MYFNIYPRLFYLVIDLIVSQIIILFKYRPQ